MDVLNCNIIIHVQCMVGMVGMVMVAAILAMYCQMLYFTDLLCNFHCTEHCH